jgi:hypothetical protein
MIIYETLPERTDVYLVDDNDGNRNMADVLSGHYVGVNESDQFLDAYEHLLELMDSGDARLIWSSDGLGDMIDATDISMVCITGALL